MKLSRRARYWFKWNGVVPGREAAKLRRHARAGLGKGIPTHREWSVAYAWRFQMRFPADLEAFGRAAGTHSCRRRT